MQKYDRARRIFERITDARSRINEVYAAIRPVIEFVIEFVVDVDAPQFFFSPLFFFSPFHTQLDNACIRSACLRTLDA